MKKAFLVLFSLFLVGMVAFSATGPGTTGAAFLKLPVSARAGGMGDALVAAPLGGEAIFWNVGSLGFQEGLNFSAMYQVWFADINTQYIGLSYNLEDIGTLGLGVVNLGMDDMDETTIDDPNGDNLGTFTAGDMSITAAFGKKVADAVSIGFGLKYISEKIADETASAFTADLGVRALFLDNALSVGLSAQNVFGKIGYNEKDSLPLIIRGGFAYSVIKSLMAVGELDYHLDSGIKYSVGAEYTIADILKVRAGYKGNDDLAGFTAGLGVKYQMVNIDFSYGLSKEDALDNIMKFSVGFHF